MMKIIIITLMSIILLCGCSSSFDNCDQQNSNVTSSQVNKVVTSESLSELESSLPSKDILSSSIGDLISSNINISRGNFNCNNTENEISNLDNLGVNKCRLAFDDDIAWDIDRLIGGNFLFYCNIFKLSGLDGFHNEFIYQTANNENIHPVGNYNFTYKFIIEKLSSTYIEHEASNLLSEFDYANKLYNYLLIDDVLYIDCSKARKQNYTDHSFVGNTWTYRYNFNYYTFNYEYIDDNTVDIEVFMTDLVTRYVVKLPLKAVLEDGEWKLEKMVFEEEIVPVE